MSQINCCIGPKYDWANGETSAPLPRAAPLDILELSGSRIKVQQSTLPNLPTKDPTLLLILVEGLIELGGEVAR